ncbi:MAG: hypothetical protein KC897_08235 [Candidatus Omnitrophica bacterium]|nr:hypothetical protein [Candidatus Omnitrophota bacterium]MCB9721448.1 hypothetical protein [Candidatus Omnitrophota bacterium]
MILEPIYLSQLGCAIVALAFGATVLRKNPRSALHLTFFFLCLSISAWQLLYAAGSYFIDLPETPTLLYRVAYSAIAFIPAFTYHHICCLTRRAKISKLIVIAYVLSLLQAAVILYSACYIEGLHRYPWGLYPAAGNYHIAFLLIFLAPLTLCYKELYDYLSLKLKRVESNKIKYALLGLIVFNFAAVDFVPNYGINLLPIGYIPALIFIIIYAIAIIKYKLLDFNLVIRKSFVYTLTFSIISSTYLLLIIATGTSISYYFSLRSPMIITFAAFALGSLFFPLRLKIQKYVDRYFFKGSCEELSLQNEKLMRQVTVSEKYRTLATLASGIAHEIRNPLTIIKTFTEFLPQKHQDEEFIQKYSTLTAKEVTRIEDLVNQLMSYSKPNPPQFRTTALRNLIEDSLDVLSSQLLSRKISCLRQIAIGSETHVNVDPNQIHQVIFNIVLNAIEAMPAGGELTVSADLLSGPGGNRARLSFRDSGPGIEADHLKQIFDPFFTQKDFGTGLGLAIVQSIIENHNGRIIARSKVGEGTEMVIELPAD